MRKRLVIPFGLTGIGKGTMCRMATEILAKSGIEFRHVSTGDILRNSNLAIGEMALRKLAPDDLMERLVVDELNIGENWFLDGFPRNVKQAKFIHKLAKRRNLAISLIYLSPPGDWQELAIARIQKRQKEENRPDATPEAIQNGFRVYHGQTVPAYCFLKKQGFPEKTIGANLSKIEIAAQCVRFVVGAHYPKPEFSFSAQHA